MPSAAYESLLFSALVTSFLHPLPFLKVRRHVKKIFLALFKYHVLLAVQNQGIKRRAKNRAIPRIRLLHARVCLTVLLSVFLHPFTSWSPLSVSPVSATIRPPRLFFLALLVPFPLFHATMGQAVWLSCTTGSICYAVSRTTFQLVPPHQTQTSGLFWVT